MQEHKCGNDCALRKVHRFIRRSNEIISFEERIKLNRQGILCTKLDAEKSLSKQQSVYDVTGTYCNKLNELVNCCHHNLDECKHGVYIHSLSTHDI